MNKRSSNLIAIGIFFVLVAALGTLIARQVDAWTNPASNPPIASPAITASGGNIGINDSTPSYRLDVNGDINFTGTLRQNGAAFSSGIGGSGTANYLSKWTSATGLGNASIFDNGNIGIGNASPGAKLDVTGNVLSNSARLGTSADLNTLTRWGINDVLTPVNGVSGQTWHNVMTMPSADSGYISQLNFGMTENYPNLWLRTKAAGTWGSWVKMIHDDGAGNVGIAGSATIGSSLNFSSANPFINASSYFIAPGGAYFNGGAVYTQSAIQARGGVHNDAGSYLMLQGGTTGKTMLSGALRFPDGTEQVTAGGSTSVSMNVSVSAADWFTGVLSPDCVQYNNGAIYYVCTKSAYATIPAGRNASCALTFTEFDDTYGPTFGVKGTLERPSCEVFGNRVTASLTFYQATPDRYDLASCYETCTVF